MAYFSVDIVPFVPNIVKRTERREGKHIDFYNPPSEAFKPLGQLDFERDSAVVYRPGGNFPELLAGAFVDLRKPLVLKHGGKEYPVGPNERNRRIAFFSLGERGDNSGVVVYGDREFCREMLQGELVIPSSDAPFIAGNILLDRVKESRVGVSPNFQELGFNYDFSDESRGSYRLAPHMARHLKEALQKKRSQQLLEEAFGNVVEIEPGENGHISLVGMGDPSAARRSVSVTIPEESMIVMERNPLHYGARFWFGYGSSFLRVLEEQAQQSI
jgi:hypothetical protein